MAKPDLLARVDALAAQALEGIRHVSPEYQPLSGTGAQINGGRWNPPESFPTLYLASDIDVAAAELRRAAERNRLDVGALLPRHVYEVATSLSDVLDLTNSTAQAAVGLSADDLRSSYPSACREVGAAAHYAGREGILAPSATNRGPVLAVFLDVLRPDHELRPRRIDVWSTPADIPLGEPSE